MSVSVPPPRILLSPLPDNIEIVEPDPDDCDYASLPPEGNVKLRNYRMLSENLRAYTPTGDIHTSPTKGKLVPKFDICATISPPRAKILELLRPEDPGREALEAIVRPAPRRALTRPLDDDTKRFLQRALLSPSPQLYQSSPNTPEPGYRTSQPGNCSPNREQQSPEPSSDQQSTATTNQWIREPFATIDERSSETANTTDQPLTQPSSVKINSANIGQRPRLHMLKKELSLAEELQEAEESERTGVNFGELVHELRVREEAVERERLGRLALAVEEDEAVEDSLTAAARRLDALLAESRDLHSELAGIQQDIQAESARACRCTQAARALHEQSLELSFLDDVVALLQGNLAKAVRAKDWPFALGHRQPGRNYIV